MFSHVHLGSNDPDKARQFYDAVITALGGQPGVRDTARNRYFYTHDGAMLIVGEPLDGAEATPGNGVTIGFRVADEAMGQKWVDAELSGKPQVVST